MVSNQVGVVHMVTHIVRTSVLAQSVHLMRALSPRLLSPYMKEIDELIRPMLGRLWGLPALSAAQQCILGAPIDYCYQ
eukprot:1514460-Amphidinium_carterae.1